MGKTLDQLLRLIELLPSAQRVELVAAAGNVADLGYAPTWFIEKARNEWLAEIPGIRRRHEDQIIFMALALANLIGYRDGHTQH